MLLVGKDKRNSSVYKGKGNKQIRFEPVFVLETNKDVGNTKIKLRKPINNNKFSELINGHKRKHKQNLNVVKKRGKSQSIAAQQKGTIKHRLSVNDQSKGIKETKLNKKKLINCSSLKNKINKPIKDSSEEDKKLFTPCFFSGYSNGNEEYYTLAQLVTGSDSLKYLEDQMMESKLNNGNVFSHNLIEYRNNIEGECSLFNSNYSTDYLNQNKEYVNSQFTTHTNVSNILVNSDLNIRSNSEAFHPNALTQTKELTNENGENKLIINSTSSDHEEYASHQLISESKTLKHISKILAHSDYNNKSNCKVLLSNAVIEITSENGNNKLFISNTSSDYEEGNSDQFITTYRTLKDMSKKLKDSDLSNKSYNGVFLPNAVNELANDSRGNILFISDSLSGYKEYNRNRLVTQPQTLTNIPEQLVKSDGVIELPSDNQSFLNTSLYPVPNPLVFISPDELASKSHDSSKNIREIWSLESSKLRLIPSKESLESDHPSMSKGGEIIKQDQNATTIESTEKHFRKLLDALDANINDIINDCQLEVQSMSKLLDEKDSNLNEHQVQDQAMVQLQSIVNDRSNDYRNENQTMKTVEDNNINDNTFSNNTNAEFTVLKQIQGNHGLILGSPEDIENNIFTRDEISPGFENLISNSHTKKIYSNEQKLTEGYETENVFGSKIYSFADILHDQISKNNYSIHFETEVQHVKVSNESKKNKFNNDNLDYVNNFREDETAECLFKNGNIQAYEEVIQKSGKAAANNEMSQENCDYDKKSSLFLSINNTENNSNAYLECMKPLVTIMNKTETSYSEEMMKRRLEEESVKPTNFDPEKNLATNEDVQNYCFEPGEMNQACASTDSLNYSQTRTKEPEESLQQLVSKSNHNIKNSDSDYDEGMNKKIGTKCQIRIFQNRKHFSNKD